MESSLHSYSTDTTHHSGGGRRHSRPPPMAGPDDPLAVSRRRSRQLGDSSDAAAVIEQEMENVQALKRLSIGAASTLDPDLPGFNPLYDEGAVVSPHSPPRSPKSGGDSPEINAHQASELLWVPAAVHPELAPNQWREFVQHKVAEIKASVSKENKFRNANHTGENHPDSSGLSRRNSRLSRIISRQEEFTDGSEVLQQRQRRQSAESLQSIASLSAHLKSLGDLESLAADPFQLRRKLSDAQGQPQVEPLANDSDVPILSTPSSSLRRSTRTQYNKSSLRRGRKTPVDSDKLGTAPPVDSTGAASPTSEILPVRKLSRSRTDPGISSNPVQDQQHIRAPLISTNNDESQPLSQPVSGTAVSANRTARTDTPPLTVPKRPVLHRESSPNKSLQRSQTFDGVPTERRPAEADLDFGAKTVDDEVPELGLATTRSSRMANPANMSESTSVLSSIPIADSKYDLKAVFSHVEHMQPHAFALYGCSLANNRQGTKGTSPRGYGAHCRRSRQAQGLVEMAI
jgi:hypothetical protein